MKKLLGLFAVALVLVQALVSCGGSKPVSSITPTPSPTGVGVVARLVLSSDKEAISSNQSDAATFTVRALDSNNVVVEGATVRVSTTGGAVSVASVETGSDGRATFTLDSGALTTNQVVTVTVSSGSAVATRTVSVVGTSFSLVTDKASVGLSGASTATLTVTVRDGSGNLIVGETFTLAAQLGTLVDTASPGTPAATLSLTTNVNGVARATYSGGATAGTDTITLNDSSSNAITSVAITISGEQFSLADARGGVMAVSDTNPVTVTWTDSNGIGVSDTVLFSTTNGTFLESGNFFFQTTTSAAGTATATLSPGSTGVAQVTVQAGTSSEFLQINVGSGLPDSVSLSISDTVLPVATGSSTPSTVVTATVRDAQNRAVSGVNVLFAVSGATNSGSGETISPGIVQTDAAGIARTTFFSGGQPSGQDGVTIEATVIDAGTGAIIATDQATLTIGGAAISIVIGSTNNLSTVSVIGPEDAYAMPFTVLVTDASGAAMAGQRVSLALFPTRFFSGFYLDNDDPDTIQYVDSFDNEDANRNGILDVGSLEDANGDGRLNPGIVASIPSSVTTDENGLAGFNVVYAKVYGRWVEIEITATADVAGTESRSVMTTLLEVMANDEPYLNSPFNTYVIP